MGLVRAGAWRHWLLRQGGACAHWLPAVARAFERCPGPAAASVMASPPGAAWEFQLPLCPGDLLRSGGSASPRLLPPAQLSGALAAFGAAFGAQGPRAVLQHFDALCSLLQ